MNYHNPAPLCTKFRSRRNEANDAKRVTIGFIGLREVYLRLPKKPTEVDKFTCRLSPKEESLTTRIHLFRFPTTAKSHQEASSVIHEESAYSPPDGTRQGGAKPNPCQRPTGPTLKQYEGAR